MKIHSRTHHITFLIPPLEFILSLLKYLLIPVAFLLLSFRLFKLPDYLENKFSISSGLWEIGLILTAASLLYLPKTIATVNNSFLWIKRKLVLLCDGGYPQFNRKKTNPLCIISKYRFPHPTYNHKSQVEIERDILSSLKRNQENKKSLLYFISGESGTGKSTLAFFICHSILVEKVFKYMDRIFYYDFGGSHAYQNNFIRDSRTLRHEDAVVIIDNFQDIQPDKLKSVTEYLINISNKNLPGCIIVLSQPLDKLSVNPGDDISLFTEIKRNYSFFELNQIDLRAIPIPSESKIWNELTKNNIIDPNLPNYSLVCLHISRLYSNVSGRNAPTRNEQTIILDNLLPKERINAKQNQFKFTKLLGIICALSIHRGGFTAKEFKTACYVNSSKSITRRCINLITYRLDLWRLTRSGFLETRSLQGKRYIFHDALAQHYKDLLYSEPIFRKTFDLAIKYLWMSFSSSGSHQLLCWLYASEIGKQSWIEMLFEQAMMKGNFKRMLLTLNRNKNLFKGKLHWDHQMGILSEKVGLFTESCSHFHQVISQSKIDKKEYSRATIALIEAEHGPDAMEALAPLVKSPEMLTRLAALYWIEHIRCHFGEFDLSKLINLADRFVEYLTDNPSLKESYFAVHLGRRIYFDLFRYFYLKGLNDFKLLVKIRDHGLGKFLQSNHVQFDAFFYKFYQAHYIHYYILYELGIFKQKPTNYDNNLIPKSYFTNVNISYFVDLAITYYQQAIDAFEVFGDKSIEYIRPRLVEMELLKENPNMDDALIHLNDFTKYINGTEFRDMKAYPHLYLYKFYYLRSFHVLQHMERSDSREPTSRILGDIDYYRKLARNELDRAIAIHSYEENRYGLLQGSFFKALTDLIDDKDYIKFRRRLLDLNGKCIAGGYNREQKIIEKCLKDDRIGLQELVDILRYYPIVLQ